LLFCRRYRKTRQTWLILFEDLDMKFMLNLCYILFIILIMPAWLNSIFPYVQSSNTPITSRVVPHNSSALPLTNKASQIQIPKLSKVVPYNSSALPPLTNTLSYTTTNATLTFSSLTLNGSTSKQFKDSIVHSTSSIIKGVRR
jgi:hypothetical protein